MAGYLGFEATDTKPYIFISYNTEDQTRLSKIAKALRDHQVNIWYDNGIHRISDEEWQEQIAIHIREAEIVFFFLTQGIFEKKNSFVKKEYDLATLRSYLRNMISGGARSKTGSVSKRLTCQMYRSPKRSLKSAAGQALSKRITGNGTTVPHRLRSRTAVTLQRHHSQTAGSHCPRH